MRNIEVTFAELRSVTTRIINIVAESGGVDQNEISIKSSINYDIGIDGDDWDDLLYKLVEKEHMNFEGFEFSKYFNSETEISNNMVYYVLFVPFIFMTFSIDRAWRHTTFKEYFSKRFGGENKQKLTVGDLIASKFAGKFIHRNEKRFKLISNCA